MCTRYRPGSQITAQATADVTGKRFLKISGGHQAGPALNTSTSGGNWQVAHADASDYAIGISSYDALTGKKLIVVGINGGEFPVTADGAITAGDKIQVGTAGKAKKLTSSGSAAAASATTGVIGSNNALTYTAKDAGAAGNGISIRILGSTGNSVSL